MSFDDGDDGFSSSDDEYSLSEILISSDDEDASLLSAESLLEAYFSLSHALCITYDHAISLCKKPSNMLNDPTNTHL